ncbi:hypothetical protein N8E89_22775 (plasmid) [Phyllobacterium sp. A18/5-2]|uniref:hypothetical protein n=1 Tax=Phyllobacterium sp. A18/5-2 TaxID=2978392 RepID=UPI0021C7F976|nr:hypothetical protein [Phyllobacterium sp. A18/5-2]UXN66053.1 hypothetical protein N8E89_22775 [Phyllobacterium sp. A18/5-2]
MIRLRSGLFSMLLLGLAISPATAEDVWSLDGFKAPESVLFDAKRSIFYVTNIAGEPTGKDGVGYLSKVSPDGKLQTAEWVTSFDAPKGLVMKGDTLFVTDTAGWQNNPCSPIFTQRKALFLNQISSNLKSASVQFKLSPRPSFTTQQQSNWMKSKSGFVPITPFAEGPEH